MNIGPYTFAEFTDIAAKFHGYPAPGLLVGAYMVEAAKAALPSGTLFEAVVESRKCLPDAVQLLTVCSTGNNRMKVVDLGRYAVSLFDKNTGEGFRAHLNIEKLKKFPELHAWFFKTKKKADQDETLLFAEIERAGDTVCTVRPVCVHKRFLEHFRLGAGAVCPLCGEGFPAGDGVICRGCRGEAPYTDPPYAGIHAGADLTVLPVEEAVGKNVLHDMIAVVPGVFKSAAFKAGQRIAGEDVPRLRSMGRFRVAVESGNLPAAGMIHENDAAAGLAERMAGANVVRAVAPVMGRADFTAGIRGLFSVDVRRLAALNMLDDVKTVTRQDGTVLDENTHIAAVRVIPLHMTQNAYGEALALLDAPLFSVLPLRRAKTGILVTGTELVSGLAEDKFIPFISAKVAQYACDIVASRIVADDMNLITRAVDEIRGTGADLLVVTGGLSVDPDDVTLAALLNAGLVDMVYGAPVLPGSMTLVGNIGDKGAGDVHMQVIGVPAGALYHKTTLFDALLPRLLAGRAVTRQETARMGEGGLCMNCRICTWPKCFFMK
ncbi:MAG: FmdE family protein [Desulfovibrio sp.]|nr:FmdE family protein [Desulfovibrio sp.]